MDSLRVALLNVQIVGWPRQELDPSLSIRWLKCRQDLPEWKDLRVRRSGIRLALEAENGLFSRSHRSDGHHIERQTCGNDRQSGVSIEF